MSDVTGTDGDQPQGEQPGGETATTRPWPAPSPDATWWQGAPVDARGPTPARHRERRDLPAAETAVVTTIPVVVAPPPPIWEPVDGDDRADWPVRTLRAMRPGRRPRTTGPAKPVRVRRPRAPRRPLPGLAARVPPALLAAFLARLSAEPLWLSLGHGTPGIATVGTCPVHGIAKRCADFTADGDGFVAGRVTLLGAAGVPPGRTVPARMVSATGSAAYVGSAAYRWVPSLLGVLL